MIAKIRLGRVPWSVCFCHGYRRGPVQGLNSSERGLNGKHDRGDPRSGAIPFGMLTTDITVQGWRWRVGMGWMIQFSGYSIHESGV